MEARPRDVGMEAQSNLQGTIGGNLATTKASLRGGAWRGAGNESLPLHKGAVVDDGATGGRLPPLRRVMQELWWTMVPRAAGCRPYAV